MKRKASHDIGIKPEAAGHWRALNAKLDQLAAEGRQTPCQRQPAAFISEDIRERREACEACQWCPARGACALFAAVNREQAGVWGGEDLSPAPHLRKGKGEK